MGIEKLRVNTTPIELIGAGKLDELSANLMELAQCTSHNFEAIQDDLVNVYETHSTQISALTAQISNLETKAAKQYDSIMHDIDNQLLLIDSNEDKIKSLNKQLTIQFILIIILLALCIYLGFKL